MIRATTKLSIMVVPLERLQVREFQIRDIAQVEMYYHLLLQHTGSYAGLISVKPSDLYPGMFAILDGHHRYCASILAGRHDALCVIEEEEEDGVEEAA